MLICLCFKCFKILNMHIRHICNTWRKLLALPVISTVVARLGNLAIFSINPCLYLKTELFPYYKLGEKQYVKRVACQDSQYS